MPSYTSLTIKPYFTFPRVKVTSQSVSADISMAWIHVEPDDRYTPLCHVCGKKSSKVHTTKVRPIRDLNMATAKVWLCTIYRKVKCAHCDGIYVEQLDFVEPYARVTKRLARYAHDLCKVMTVKEVAEHLGLDWKRVKEIDKTFLEEEFGETDYGNLTILAVDEISRGRHHDYLTVVLDYRTGRIVWIGEERKKATLDAFFKEMPKEVRDQIEAVAMDMWDPFIASVREWCPGAKIVFDLFHVVQAFNKVIDKVRNQEYRDATEQHKEVIKGSKYLLLKNKENLKDDEKPHLKELLKLNQNISTVYILKDDLKKIWRYTYTKWAEKALDRWCQIARESELVPVMKFVEKLERHRYGILNHCRYPIHNGKLEGVNNTLKVIKRDAYGFLDTRYYILKAKQAFPGNFCQPIRR
jgi:transposase